MQGLVPCLSLGLGLLSMSTHLDGVFALREVLLALLGLLQLPRGVLRGEAATDGTGLLGAEVEGHVLLVLVEQAHVVSLLGVDDGQDTGDRLAEVVAMCKDCTSASFGLCRLPLLHVHSPFILPRAQMNTNRDQSMNVVMRYRESSTIIRAYILFSLVPEEAIFWMRS